MVVCGSRRGFERFKVREKFLQRCLAGREREEFGEVVDKAGLDFGEIYVALEKFF